LTSICQLPSAALLRKTRADLYWARIGEQWGDWNEIQFTSLRFALAVAGFGLGMVVIGEPVFALVGAVVGFQYPAMRMGGVARKMRRQFIAQLPEYVQLVSAQMSAPGLQPGRAHLSLPGCMHSTTCCWPGFMPGESRRRSTIGLVYGWG
jgi:Flp pilus assembly protein TadB